MTTLLSAVDFARLPLLGGLLGKGIRLLWLRPRRRSAVFLSPIHWDGHWIDKGPQFFDNFEPQDVELIEEMIGPDVMQEIGFGYASYMGGELNCDFAIPDWQAFGDDVARAAFHELLDLRIASDGKQPTLETFDDLLAWDGGPKLQSHLRTLTKKFVGREAHELSPAASAMVTFLGRKKFFHQELTIDLKKSPMLDGILAAKKATVREERSNLYPKGSSLETARVALEKALKLAGVQVYTNTILNSFDAGSGVALGETVEIGFDQLFFGTDIRDSERLLTGGTSISESTYVLPEIFHCYVVPVSTVAAPFYIVDYDPTQVATRITNFATIWAALIIRVMASSVWKNPWCLVTSAGKIPKRGSRRFSLRLGKPGLFPPRATKRRSHLEFRRLIRFRYWVTKRL